jgi:hypothetical protein
VEYVEHTSILFRVLSAGDGAAYSPAVAQTEVKAAFNKSHIDGTSTLKERVAVPLWKNAIALMFCDKLFWPVAKEALYSFLGFTVVFAVVLDCSLSDRASNIGLAHQQMGVASRTIAPCMTIPVAFSPNTLDWAISGRESIILRTLWEVTADQTNPRLVSAFIR